MKILFVCAGGMSTGLIVKKMEKWAVEKDLDLTVHATGLGGWERQWKDYDCILVGPQVRFKIDEIRSGVEIPVAQIEPQVYGLQDVDKIMKQAIEITKGEN